MCTASPENKQDSTDSIESRKNGSALVICLISWYLLLGCLFCQFATGETPSSVETFLSYMMAQGTKIDIITFHQRTDLYLGTQATFQ